MARQRPEMILALDVDTGAQALEIVSRLYPTVKVFKVGLQLFASCGPDIVRAIQKRGAEVFLDLKYFDIPNTVAHAVRQAVQLKVKMCTMHILGDEEMIKAAVKAAREESEVIGGTRPLLIGVTVLTSKEANPADVLTLARLGIQSGLDGVVCSAREVAMLKLEIQKNFVAVTPGIRAEKAASNDQKRTATVEEAVRNGSDFLVVGRPVLEAKDMLSAAGLIQSLIAEAWKPGANT
jgi:orotidine-5'-phosphate decarboxylase